VHGLFSRVLEDSARFAPPWALLGRIRGAEIVSSLPGRPRFVPLWNPQKLMIAKCACLNCGQHMEFEAESAGQLVPCPACGKQTRLLMPLKSFTPESVKSKLDARLSPEAATLKMIRGASCYKTLRTVIELSMGILLGILLLAAIGWVVGCLFSVGELGMTSFPMAALGVVALIFVAVLVLALRQSCLLLIDIADCQIRLAGKTD
jgi:hypothetical protein